MVKLVLITCPKCGYTINGRLWRCPGCGGANDNDISVANKESPQDAKNIIATLSARIRKLF